LLDGIENETVVAVVHPERTIPGDCRYSLVELVADAKRDIPVDVGSAAADQTPSCQVEPGVKEYLPRKPTIRSSQVALSSLSTPPRRPPLNEGGSKDAVIAREIACSFPHRWSVSNALSRRCLFVPRALPARNNKNGRRLSKPATMFTVFLSPKADVQDRNTASSVRKIHSRSHQCKLQSIRHVEQHPVIA
jgi:hypothetical protein